MPSDLRDEKLVFLDLNPKLVTYRCSIFPFGKVTFQGLC